MYLLGILFPDMPNLPNGGIASCSVSWTPSFLLKRYVLTGIHDGPHEPFIADSVDFVVCQVKSVLPKLQKEHPEPFVHCNFL